MSITQTVEERQFLAAKSSSSPSRTPAAFCTPFTLPSGGILQFNDSYSTTLTENVEFRQPCLANFTNVNPGSSGNTTVVGLQGDPFYASTSPQIFAIATATVISYLLVILIFITPRTFFIGGNGGGAGVVGRRGVTNGASSVIGVGRRPWLQKIATITVAVSLTIATADTFRVAKDQYYRGYIDSGRLTDEVVESTEIRVVRVISDTFLWLAQVQTLIRLFPRHKEKVTIKWLGFAMVSFDTIFSILNDFIDKSARTRPHSFNDAIPALSYLFELAISLIYASCVIYYSLSKRRFAFYHPKMRNVCLVALLSLMAVLVPVVFFVLDVSNPNIATWGDYIRWVGAAAASVVVWEWVERIEALERDERKDGILGREIFDGDEMLDDGAGPSDEVQDWPGRREYWDRNGYPTNGDGETQGGNMSQLRGLKPRIPFAKKFSKRPEDPTDQVANLSAEADAVTGPSIPPQIATPISRSDTTSAASTVYAIRYHPVGSPSPAIPEERTLSGGVDTATGVPNGPLNPSTTTTDDSETTKVARAEPSTEIGPERPRELPLWKTVPHPFKRKRTSPPVEVAGAQLGSATTRRSPVDMSLGLRSRFRGFGSSRRDRLPGRTTRDTAPPIGVTVIPAQRREPHSRQRGGNEVREEFEPDDPGSDFAPVASGGLHAALTIPQSPFRQHHDSAMPITVIPAPRRGQRTWSPDDLRIDEPGHLLQTFPSQRIDDQPGSPTVLSESRFPGERAQSSPDRTVLSTRGNLRFAEHARRLTPLRTVSESTAVSHVTQPPQPPGLLASGSVTNRELAGPSSWANSDQDRRPSAPDQRGGSNPEIDEEPGGTVQTGNVAGNNSGEG